MPVTTGSIEQSLLPRLNAVVEEVIKEYESKIQGLKKEILETLTMKIIGDLHPMLNLQTTEINYHEGKPFGRPCMKITLIP